jgi:putative hydrolase of the HAD superfamily
VSTAATSVEPVRDVVVLDIDDTLYLERDYVASGFRAVGKELADQFGCTDFADHALRLFESGVRTRIFDTVLEEQGVAASADLIERLVSVYRAHQPTITLAPDADSFIARRSPGRALAIISDGFLVAQQAKVRALGLNDGLFSPIVLTDEFGRTKWKPHEHAFRLVQEHFGLPAGRFIYIADNPAKDFMAPHALGWKTARVRRRGGLHRDVGCNPPPHVEVTGLGQITEALLDELLGREDHVRGRDGTTPG